MRRVGNYELLKKIGAGGMAEVWMGRRASVSGVTKAVAVKLLAGTLAHDERYRQMFMDEARLSMLLSHSNIVQVFDVGREGENSYLVMEWVDGLNLAQIASLMRDQERPIPVPVVGYVIGELLRALSYAHTVTHEGAVLGIVHRDVSPQNVLVSVSGEVKLTDFGVARLGREDTSGVHVKGKLRYMAPEQLAGNSKVSTVDLYAVGAMLHELLDGQKFRGELDEAQLYGHVVGGVLPDLQTEVPAELDALRLALLEPDPSSRVQSADQALELLGRWPGYRTADTELARLCREFVGVQAPRSGITAPSAGRPEVSRDAAGRASKDSTPTRTSDPEVTVRPAGPSSAVAPARRWLWGGAGVGAGALLLGGTLAVLGVFSPRSEHEPTRPDPELANAGPAGKSPASPAGEPEAPEPELPAPKPEPEPEAEPEPELESPEPEPGGSSEEGASERAPEVAKQTPSRTKKKRGLAPKVGIRFRLSGLRLAYVRIDGKRTLVLEPTAKTTLRAGKHRLQWRKTESDSWRDGGVVRLDAGKAYIVKVSAKGLHVSVQR